MIKWEGLINSVQNLILDFLYILLTYTLKTHIMMEHMLVCIKILYFGGVINEKNISTK